jgi:hypothetical protein
MSSGMATANKMDFTWILLYCGENYIELAARFYVVQHFYNN